MKKISVILGLIGLLVLAAARYRQARLEAEERFWGNA